ncbi:Dabb family protein [Paracoccus pacificus]|uniref:Dabb family protein n=1 Tax=Paracoccus pacificus TaxID=1463598 RepID=A0ABW4R1Y8_9RHOB
MIRHIVALRFRPGTPDRVKQGLYDDLAALSGHIDGILDFKSFRNVSVETPLVRGFNDLFWFDLRDEVARDAYLADPAHQAVGARILAETDGGAEGIFVADIRL